MPVEITLPLTRLEQAVADARENEKEMAAKVEDAKLVLKTAKASWEEAVGEVFRALDEMITDKRAIKQRGLFDDDDGKTNGGSADPAPGPTPGTPPTGGSDNPSVTVTQVEVEIIPATTAIRPSELAALAALPAGPSWRPLVIADHIDGPPALFDTLAVFGVETLGQLADALKDGRTFNLKLVEVDELMEAIEDASQEDPEPVKFGREAEKEEEDGSEADTGNSDVLSNLFTPEPEPATRPEPEPAKSKKGRGGKKGKAQATAATETGEAVEVKPAETAQSDFDGL